MGARKGISLARLKKISARQENAEWNGNYVPSILATPQEAPSISHAFVLTPEKLNGRETHLLSTPERNACLLGLYHPQVVGLQEQRMLSPGPCEHPLWTFLGIDRTPLPPIKGIIDVADRLGYLDTLPRLKVDHPNPDQPPKTVIFPLIGDLLWAVQPSAGNIHCVNWTIKSSEADFKRPISAPHGLTVSEKRSRSLLARHEVEEIFYKDSGIRTIRVSDEAIDRHVSANLRQLFLHHRQPLGLTAAQKEEILRKYQVALQCGLPPVDVILQLTERGRYSVYQARTSLFQAIWNRELRVDLFSPILTNRPLKPESRDVVEVYADWFTA